MAWMLGEVAGLMTSVCWSGSSIGFTLASKRVGSVVVNHVRLWMAIIVLSIIHLAIFHTPYPVDAGSRRFLWLGVSGLIGYSIGDSLLFEAFVRIGPRLTMLIMTLSPAFAAVLAWLFLGEGLAPLKILGMGITICGIALVVWLSGHGANGARSGRRTGGVLMGTGAAVCQAAGLLLSKIGMQGGYSTFSANLIRLSAAAIAISIMAAIRKELWGDIRTIGGNRPALAAALGGTLAGPVLGVLLMLYSVTHTYVGIASTLMALPPVFLLPISHYLFDEEIGMGAIIGTFISLAGVVLLFV